ncbi:hypothetical protein [Dactylosporangium sp. CA-233914]|uniref:hypothetical protein n=1 Tax=Dactylosporangium sp. CA-233914 TaxID=3239934 RepID=UPI003D917B7E
MTRQTWRSVLDGRLDHAVSAMAELADSRPGNPKAQALFDQFAAADPRAVRRAGSLITRPLPVRHPDSLAFAPDLCEFAVLGRLGQRNRVEMFDLPTGEPRDSFLLRPDREGDPLYRDVVHLGDAIVVTESYNGPRNHLSIVRYRRPGWVREVIAEPTSWFYPGMAAVPGGFIVGGAGEFLIGSGDGPIRQAPADGDVTVLAGDPISGRVAVTIRPTFPEPPSFAVLDPDLRVVARHTARSETDEVAIAWFCGPDRVLTCGMWKYLRAWEAVGGELVQQGGEYLPKYELQFPTHQFPLGLTYVPGHDLVALEFPAAPPRWYDPARLDRVEAPDPFGKQGFPLWISPGGEYALLEDHDGVLELADLRLANLVTRPMAGLGPADLEPLARREGQLDDDAKLVLSLLRARLAYV